MREASLLILCFSHRIWQLDILSQEEREFLRDAIVVAVKDPEIVARAAGLDLVEWKAVLVITLCPLCLCGDINAEDTEVELNRITEQIIGAAIEVHKALGPGLMQSAYEECLCRELALHEIPFERQRPLPVEYKGVKLDCGYRLDLLVEGAVVVEIKAVVKIEPIHETQLLTYLKLGGWKLGLLMNFNVPVLKNGIRRRIL